MKDHKTGIFTGTQYWVLPWESLKLWYDDHEWKSQMLSVMAQHVFHDDTEDRTAWGIFYVLTKCFYMTLILTVDSNFAPWLKWVVEWYKKRDKSSAHLPHLLPPPWTTSTSQAGSSQTALIFEPWSLKRFGVCWFRKRSTLKLKLENIWSQLVKQTLLSFSSWWVQQLTHCYALLCTLWHWLWLT